MSSLKGEKGGMLPSTMPASRAEYRTSARPFSRVRWGVILCFVSVCLYTVLIRGDRLSFLPLGDLAPDAESSALCPQASPLIPEKNGELWQSMIETYKSDAFLGRAVNWLSGAVQIPTPSFDQMLPVGEDPRWEVFAPLHEYLLKVFPQTHATLELTKVNTYGLVYVWKGSDSSLKPLLLTAHQDVVPVNPDTYDQWVHPPFSGYFDGKLIWGRGSRDDKSGLIGIMSAVESLLESGFKPTRGIVLAFGFDEETSGTHGAQAIGEYMLSRFGENAFAMLVDEGGKITKEYGAYIALPSVGEKGYIDIRLSVTSPGGHSSVPPRHTSIGILAALLVQYEENPIPPVLSRHSPMFSTAQCLAAHAPDVSSSLRKTIAKAATSDKALRAAQEALFEDSTFEALVGTTQAIDLIDGGVKTNALPENAEAVVNHRIATDSSVDAVKEHSTAILKSVAAGFNLSYTAFGSSISGEGLPAYGTLTLSDAWGTALEAAPVTPSGPDAAPFQLLSGTIKSTWKNYHSSSGEGDIVVAPSLVSGNTDTRFYWALTEHIFRYNHYFAGSGTGLEGVHTINEACVADGFIEIIGFFTTLILNADEASF
ncbi:carboxypeptidase S [Amylocystis lapponica]|nr:carboxypeptidase S [Amylocystis lapponica]